ncbi:hypothetical protein M271_43565 [Streptomyces rapamycinicus NRRL 5491]|uniref:hypothetical protein n=1 Tax=Streptomyces rapamycinicus TaxID=1226757 RepID=UPI000382F7F0|nr:hypothetical protein [Streptomyces rapamycinicus]AGP60083.1 hypothetical protein M271_43565 [Streptomyces rapamycinicus NRRL 5491]
MRETATVGLPSPKSKVTLEVGVPAVGGTPATTAVKVTGWPTTEGSGAEVRVVVDGAT